MDFNVSQFSDYIGKFCVSDDLEVFMREIELDFIPNLQLSGSVAP